MSFSRVRHTNRCPRLVILAAAAAASLAAVPDLAAPAGSDWNGRCAGGQVEFTTTGKGAVLEGPNRPVARKTLAVGAQPYLAENVTVTFTMQRTTFVISPGTSFRPECYGAYGKGPYPDVKLYRGKARVKGTAKSPQQTGIRTWEAIAHTLKPHGFEYTVERTARTPADGDAGKGRVTVTTLKGGPIMLSPRKGLKKQWACKTGQTFTVDWQGNVNQH
jgi:opacity protein-like surface antigen